MGISNQIPNSRLAQPGVCTSTTRPASPYEGQMIYETDTNRVLVYDASAWVMIADTDEPPGMQLIKAEQIGSGVSNHTISSCFSADYKNYFVQIETVFSALANRIWVRGTASTGTTYAGNFFYMDTSSTTVFGAANASASYFDVGLTSSTGFTNVNLWLYNINDATVATRIVSQFAGHTYSGSGGGRDTATNSSTALYFQPATGTMTGGNVRVYGYRN